ncbi:hypothetical protein ACFW96_27580 [Streptomyces gardneri]|uniref:hypothetical protein n=1 Tax=Streptomyces gardneri TaxID=66892 RepID=UPI0036C165D8
MTDTTRWPYLPPDRPFDVMTVDDRWCALSIPLDWAPLVVGVLGDLCGPAYAETGLNRAYWLLPSGAGTDWPDLSGAALDWHRTGTEVLVPGPDGCASMAWHRYPLDDVPVFTEPGALRLALQTLLGPLETAGALGPVAICHFCDQPSRDVTLIAWGEQMSGPGWSQYACRPCADRRGLRDVRADL